MKLERNRGLAVLLSLVGVLGLALLVPAAAAAQAAGGPSGDPTVAQYEDRIDLCVVDPDDPRCTPSNDDPRRVAGLPFTGLEVGGLALLAFTLLGGGLLLRRLGRAPF